ncbi:methyltransferase domain-containing protein [bacterium SCSIO 12696]|nr:methyltransferase domain-containing protein [bacterium SCSIO 12696]
MPKNDRNFDNIADHFARKIYGGLKGEIRLGVLWRDLNEQVLRNIPKGASVLDAGTGLGQIASGLANQSYEVTASDISAEMLALAKQRAEGEGSVGKIRWLQTALQLLHQELSGQTFDLVMCHAVLEWLAEPQQGIAALAPLLSSTGYLSLTFYNRDALVYRNLIRGNFNKATSNDFAGDPNSLTPPNPLTLNDVESQLAQHGLKVIYKSGIRVFHDYVRQPSGGNQLPDAIKDMELLHSSKESFIGLGRYIHLLCRPC